MARDALIVLLEDERAQLLTLEATLEGLGEVHGFSSGASALDFLRERQADAAIIDVHMGEQETGIEFIRHLREFDPDLAVIVRTGDDSSTLADEAIAVGAYRRAVKSRVTIEEVRELTVAAIHETARKRRLTGDAADTVGARNDLLQSLTTRNESASMADYYRTVLHGIRTDLTAVGAVADLLVQAVRKKDNAAVADFVAKNQRLASRLLAEMNAFLDGPFGQLGASGENPRATVNGILEHLQQRFHAHPTWVADRKSLVTRGLLTDLHVGVHPLRLFGAVRTVVDFFLRQSATGSRVRVLAEYAEKPDCLLQTTPVVVVCERLDGGNRGWVVVTVSGLLPGVSVADLQREIATVPQRPQGEELHLVELLLSDQSAVVALRESKNGELHFILATPIRW